MTLADNPSPQQLVAQIRLWARELGFQQVGIADIDLDEAGARLREWLAQGFHGTMDWMAVHGSKRWRPDQLLPGALSVISVRMDYLPPDTGLIACLRDGEKAYLSRYALGRDYHKLIRRRLTALARKIEDAIGAPVVQRPFVDSAPVMEKPFAEKAGLGWIGKNTLLLNDTAGSWFFLGELFTQLPLPPDTPAPRPGCGNCRACLKVCPTNAFPAPYVLDARRCISYLTIEHQGSIPVEFRAAMGNRVFGCDDCQIICPWNRFAKPTAERAFHPRHQLDNGELATLFLWSENEFMTSTAGSPIRRIGHERWLRNLAVGLGNAPGTPKVINALRRRQSHASSLVREHVHWALAQHGLPAHNDRAPSEIGGNPGPGC